MQAGVFLGFLVAITILWFLGMTYASATWLGPEGAFPPLDARPFGYHPAQVEAWLAGLTERGRLLLLGPYRWADTVLALLLGATLALAAFAVGRRWLAALALAYVVLDLAENAAIAAILRAGDLGADPALVGRASGLTVGKWAVLLPLSAALIAFALRGRR
jgi:hypothetical protein